MHLESDVPLGPLTTMGVGGKARFFVHATSEEDVGHAFEWSRAHGHATRVLGGGSNIVAPDGGVDGLVVALRSRGLRFEDAGNSCRVSAEAGEPWDELVSATVERGLQGLECLSGIPGLVGATPIQNVGAYGQEVKDTIFRLRAFDRHERRFVELDASACEFSYRDSRFKSREPDRFVVTRVTFELAVNETATPRYPELRRALEEAGRAPTLKATREAVLALRRRKSMIYDVADPNHRSCGSFFLNPVVSAALAVEVERRFPGVEMPRFPAPGGLVKLSAAWLIERAGFTKGTRAGNVGISSRHALALICADGASSRELLEFAAQVRKTVLERTGVAVSPEPCVW